MAVLAGALAAQTPAPTPAPAATNAAEITTREETPTFQSRVSLVRVPVVVRDHAGKTVGGLGKEDFQVYDKGKLQRLAVFSAEGSAVPKPKAAVPEETPSPLETAEPSKPGEPAKPPAVLPTRFIAYVFDDVHLAMGDLMQARLAATKHMDQALRPTDRAAIYTLSGHVSIEFTDDHALLRAALLKIMPTAQSRNNPPLTYYVAEQVEKGDDQDPNNPAFALAVNETILCLNLQGPAAVAAPGIARSTVRQVQMEGQQQNRSTLLMLKTLAGRLAAMPGDRNIILVSPGFYLADDLRSDIAQVIDRAVRANVIINTLDARGVYVASTMPDLPGCSQPDGRLAEQLRQYDDQESIADGLTLDELADGTGGTSFRNNNDLFAGFNGLAAPPEHIYYLGFYPENLKPDGSYHALKVKLPNQKGLSIKARKGYWAPSHLEDEAAQSSREIQEAVFSRDELRDLPIDLHTQFFKATDEDARLKVITHLDLRAARFRKDEGRNRDDVTLVCALFDRNGNFLKGIQKVVEMRLRDESMPERLSKGIDVGAEFDVKTGAYMVRVVVRDAGGRQMAAANASAEIP
jgi:VWFA-related protein